MGLGKTIQALGAVLEEFACVNDGCQGRPKLIVCPNSVKGVWAREIVKWLGDNESRTRSSTARYAQGSAQPACQAINENAFVDRQLRAASRQKEKLKSSTASGKKSKRKTSKS
jgi:SNF2 family DNA or RNA helicase